MTTPHQAPTAAAIEAALTALADPQRSQTLQRFFKTGKGEYAEGDRFLGLTVPATRAVARQFADAPDSETTALLKSRWHECRLCALMILAAQSKKGDSGRRHEIMKLYVDNAEHIDNWDLVDLTAPAIVGEPLRDHSRDILYTLAGSPLLWKQRIAMVATLALIRGGEYDDTIALAEMFIRKAGQEKLHDLMQKATGWMLREVGKRDAELLRRFLDRHHREMPRTMLRYSIERLSDNDRRHYMSKG